MVRARCTRSASDLERSTRLDSAQERGSGKESLGRDSVLAALDNCPGGILWPVLSTGASELFSLCPPMQHVMTLLILCDNTLSGLPQLCKYRDWI